MHQQQHPITASSEQNVFTAAASTAAGTFGCGHDTVQAAGVHQTGANQLIYMKILVFLMRHFDPQSNRVFNIVFLLLSGNL